MSTENRWNMDLPPWRGGKRNTSTGRTHWQVETGPLSLDVGPLDWRPFQTLRLNICSPKRTGARIRLDIFGCDEEPIGHITFAVDWVGENDMQLWLSNFAPQEGAREGAWPGNGDERWHLVHMLRLSCEQPGLWPTELELGAFEVTSATPT